MFEWNWWVLAAVIPAWLIQNILHESSHLLVGWVHQGLKPLGMWPYPHVHNGRFYFARYRCEPPSAPDPPRTPRHAAPMFAGALTAACCVVALVFAPVSARIWLVLPAVTGLVDFLWFWRGFFWGTRRCDGKRWRYGGVGYGVSGCMG